MSEINQKFSSFSEFWPFYVLEHTNPLNRRLHVFGTALAVLLAFAATQVSPWLWALVPIVGYGFAWIGHFKVQGNKPATFRYPLWSLLADLKMLALTCAGRMNAEVSRCIELHDARSRAGAKP